MSLSTILTQKIWGIAGESLSYSIEEVQLFSWLATTQLKDCSTQPRQSIWQIREHTQMRLRNQSADRDINNSSTGKLQKTFRRDGKNAISRSRCRPERLEFHQTGIDENGMFDRVRDRGYPSNNITRALFYSLSRRDLNRFTDESSQLVR